MAQFLKPYKKYDAAVKAAAGRPILRVGNLYLVGDISTITELAVITPKGNIAGFVGAAHLLRLGNANGAHPMERDEAKCRARVNEVFPNAGIAYSTCDKQL